MKRDTGDGGGALHRHASDRTQTKCGSAPLRLPRVLLRFSAGAGAAAVGGAAAVPLPPSVGGSSGRRCMTLMPWARRQLCLAGLLVRRATEVAPRSRRMWAAQP